MHTAAEIGIDDFQSSRSPDKRYRTTPLRGLFTRQKGGFYHDGRFPTLGSVVDHYDRYRRLPVQPLAGQAVPDHPTAGPVHTPEGRLLSRWTLPNARERCRPLRQVSTTSSPAARRTSGTGPPHCGACSHARRAASITMDASQRSGALSTTTTAPWACLLYTSPSPRD